MSEVVSRAGFNVRHLRHGQSGTRSDRASLLHESMRELSPRASAFYAATNPNIIAQDTILNVAMVNDGSGGFRRARSTKEVLDYGDARIGTAQNEKGEDRVGNSGRKWDSRSFETTLIVAALPKSLCVEIPDVYPVLDDDGKEVLDVDGQPLRRSRWVARDRDEALAYFEHVVAYLGEEVLVGGQSAIHGYDVNFDESYPHVQIMADTLAPDTKKPGQLRVAAQAMWGIDRSVRAGGKVEQPEAKMRRYQKGLRDRMIELGYQVEAEAAPRSTASHTREEWAALQEAKRIAEAERSSAQAYRGRVDAWQRKLEGARRQILHDRAALDADREALDADRAELPELRRRARSDGREEGRAEALAEAAEDRRRAARDRAQAAEELDAARRAREAAERAQRAAEETPKEFERFLDRPRAGGQTLRPRYEAEVEKSRRIRQRALRDLESLPPDDLRRRPRGLELG